MNLNPELKEKLLQAKSLEEAKQILGDSIGQEDLEKLLATISSSVGQGLTALGDDDLESVAGGISFPGIDFNLNTWLGKLLRELMKKDSVRNAENGRR